MLMQRVWMEEVKVMKKQIIVLGMIMSASYVVAEGNSVTSKAVAASSSQSKAAIAAGSSQSKAIVDVRYITPESLTDAKLATSEVDSAMSLQELVVNAHFAKRNATPLSLSVISPEAISLHAAAPNYLEMFQGIPGVYATASTGSYGDATLNMRGFKQDNIAILLNGIPIQGLTSGSMYWSNWMGLADATYAVQVQKGLGSHMLTDCAMGGMINIVTKSCSEEPRTDFGFSLTEAGTKKVTLTHNTGLLKNGWSINANLSYVQGNSVVEATNIKTFSYMLNVSKILNATNTLIFTALGSPEKHDQRNTELSAAEVDKYGTTYSKNWGYLGGEKKSIGHNHYIKPYFTLQHINDGERLSMKNSIYLAIADGGGTSTYNNYKSGVKGIIDHQTADGHIDFASIVAENQADGVSKNVLIDYLSGHTQAGGIVSAEYKFSDMFKLGSGLQYQYYDTWSKMEILDMLGGTTFKDPATGAVLGLGDYVGSRYGRTTHHASGFLQGTLTAGQVVANLGVSVFNGNYRRHNDETGEKSEWAHGWGASVKGGVIWNINDHHSVYINGGYNSRLPYANTFLASSNLTITNDITNETNIMAEAGWRPTWNGGGMELSAYLASWKDKTVSVSLQSRANEQKENYLVKGLNALHMGVEMNAYQQFTSWLKATAYCTVASWKWKSEGKATIYDKYTNEELSTFTAYCDGLHVGDAPQTQLGATLDAKLGVGFYAHASWQYNARMFADFDPSKRNNANDTADAYQLPDYSLFDATVGWTGMMAHGVRLNVYATCRNIFDAKYIERGTDGANHDRSTFRGYWGAPRQMSIGMKFMF